MRGLTIIILAVSTATVPASARDPSPLPATLMTSPAPRDHTSYRLDPRAARAAYELDRLAAAGVRALKFERARYRPSPLDAKVEWRTSGLDSRFGLAGAIGKVVNGLGH